MEAYNMQVIPKALPYPPLSIEGRKKILPERNVCSITPAEILLDAMFTGNGKQRIDILGDPANEYIVVSHELLYAPKWAKTPEPPDYSAVLSEARRLLRAGQFAESAALIDKEQRRQDFDDMLSMSGDNHVMPPSSLRKHPAYRLKIHQETGENPINYLRFTDLMSGESVVRWESNQGEWSRKALASYKDDAVVIEFNPPKSGLLNLDIELVLPGEEEQKVNSTDRYRAHNLQKSSVNYNISNDMITIAMAYNPEFGQKGNVTAIRLLCKGGEVTSVAKGLKITGADYLLVLSRTQKIESGFHNGLVSVVEKSVRALEEGYQNYLNANKDYLGGRMGLSRLYIEKGDEWAMSTEEILRQQHTCDEFSAVLLDKLYDMGRFYQIIDTGELPPSYGQHNINTNLQVCAGNMTGLDHEMEVYFRFYESKFDDFRINAKRLFNARGLLATIHCDYDSGLFYHSSISYPHHFWTGCLGWIYNELWGHYLTTGDKKFMRDRIIPALKEIALFFEDYARDTDESGQSIFYPSFSPENPSGLYSPPGCYPSSINSVMDIMICREVLDNLIEGCEELGIESENIPHWKEQRAKLPKYLLDEEGGLKEWAWPTVKENYNHRHVSHHYDAWPGHVVTWEDTPELAKSILISNRKRALQNDSAHGVIHRLFTAIRLKDKSDTVQNLKHLMEHGYVTRSFGTSHNPYLTVQFPDLQGAMPAILAEMAIYSAPGVVELLPAMPDSLSRGSIFGVWLFTFAKLEQMSWDLDKKTIEGSIIPFRDQELVLRYRPGNADFIINGLKTGSNMSETKIMAEKEKRINFTLNINGGGK